jgi:transcriptional regulator of heat shock response
LPIASALRELLQNPGREEAFGKKSSTNVLDGDRAQREVRVGDRDENAAPSMKRCAVIYAQPTNSTTTCQGTVGVVGPTRIEYGRTMAVVNYLARFIERALSNEASLH